MCYLQKLSILQRTIRFVVYMRLISRFDLMAEGRDTEAFHVQLLIVNVEQVEPLVRHMSLAKWQS